MSSCAFSTSSVHRTSEGVVVYEACARCGRRRIRLDGRVAHGAPADGCPAVRGRRLALVT